MSGARMPSRPRAASEQVAVGIQHHIQQQGLAPGDFLGRVEDLATRFGVSRPTLREALKLLASSGLVRTTRGPGGGVFVANTAGAGIGRGLGESIGTMLETSAVSLDELLDASLLLQAPLAGRAAEQADRATIERLRAALEAERAAEPGDLDALAAAEAEFHRAIASAAGNRVAEALGEWIVDVLQPTLLERVRATLVASAVADRHEALLLAIERSDAPAAEQALRDHLRYLQDVLRVASDAKRPVERARLGDRHW